MSVMPTDTVADVVIWGHKYGGMQLKTNHYLSCKNRKTADTVLRYESDGIEDLLKYWEKKLL